MPSKHTSSKPSRHTNTGSSSRQKDSKSNASEELNTKHGHQPPSILPPNIDKKHRKSTLEAPSMNTPNLSHLPSELASMSRVPSSAAHGLPSQLGKLDLNPRSIPNYGTELGLVDKPPIMLVRVDQMPTRLGPVDKHPTKLGLVDKHPTKLGLVDQMPTRIGQVDNVLPQGSVLTNSRDITMASRQMKYKTLPPQVKQEQDAWAHERIHITGVCPNAWSWHRIDDGYRCFGGTHVITDHELAKGKGAFFVTYSFLDGAARYGPMLVGDFNLHIWNAAEQAFFQYFRTPEGQQHLRKYESKGYNIEVAVVRMKMAQNEEEQRRIIIAAWEQSAVNPRFWIPFRNKSPTAVADLRPVVDWLKFYAGQLSLGYSLTDSLVMAPAAWGV